MAIKVLNEEHIDRELNNRFGSRLMDMPEAHTWFAGKTEVGRVWKGDTAFQQSE